jgi:hypothetical protein
MLSCTFSPAQFSEIPSSLKKLKDDPYRTFSRYVRTSHAFVKCGGKTAHLPQYVVHMPLKTRNDGQSCNPRIPMRP